MEKNQQSTAEQYSEQIEQLMELGRTQGYLTYAEINDLLPEDVIDPEYYDKLLQTLQNDAGIPVLDEAPESDEMMLNDTIPDEDAVEEATQILSNVESEIGRTTDPVRMYMREMGNPLIFLLVKMKSALQNVLKKELMKFKHPLQPILKL